MTMSLNSAIARIRTADDVVVGAGFLVSQRQVLTCTHVIDTALDRPRNTLEIFQTEVHLDAKRTADEGNTRWEGRRNIRHIVYFLHPRYSRAPLPR